MSGPRIAVYPGSFDPITRGHEDLIRRAFTFADRVVVAVAVNAAKQPLFTLAERVALIQQAVATPHVDVRSFEGLLAEFARSVGASVIVRGLRAVSDFEYEFQMALMNRNLAPGIETVFLVPAFDLTYLSSSLVRGSGKRPSGWSKKASEWWKSWSARIPHLASRISSVFSVRIGRLGSRRRQPRAPRSSTRSPSERASWARGSRT